MGVGLKREFRLRRNNIPAAFGVFSGAFILSVMASSVFAPANRSNADTLVFEDQDSGYTASVSSANTIELDVAATTGGTLARAHDTVNIVTDNPEGYTLYLSMNNVSDYSVSKPGNALYLDGNSTSTSFINPTSGTSSEPSSLGTNEWGYSLADNLAFSKVPLRSNPDTVATSDSATTAEGDNLDVYYGVNVNSALPTGSYTGVVNYSVLSDYSGESSDKAGVFPDTITTKSNVLGNYTITLSTNLYTTRTFQNSEVSVLVGASGQEQACTINEVSTASGQLVVSCTLPTYTFTDEGTYTYPITLSIPSYGKTYSNITLSVEYEGIPAFWSISKMQDMTPEVCSSVYTPNNTISMTDENIITKARFMAGDYNVNSDYSSPLVPETTLEDDRDADGTGTKKSYKVRKLADGNCWMVENLEYDLLALYNNGKRGIGSRNDGSTFEMTDANLATGVAGYYTTTANAFNYVINPNTKPLTNITRTSYLGDVTGQTEYYYNWTAATAGQGSQTNTSGTIDGSICPAGWRLPTNYTDTTNQNTSWSALTNAYLGITENTSTTTGYQTLDQYPISLYRAGFVYSGSQSNVIYGYYWSSTTYNANGVYSLYYVTSLVRPQDHYNKRNGYPIRCVAPAKKTFWTIETMQEMTPEICATVYTPTNAVSMTDENIITKERYLAGDYTATRDNSSPLVPEVTLLDDRDADGTGTKKSYKVRKLADGNCWMVENLAYDLVGLYNNGKRGIGSRNDGSTFEMTDANLATGVAGYYTTTNNAHNYVINPNTKPLTNITRQSYLGDVTGQTEYYYSWTAATAGQGSQTNTSGTIDGSICPAGWRLPTNYTDTTNQNISWSALTNAYLGITTDTSTPTGYQTLDQYPVSLYRAGNVYSGSRLGTAYGSYWSSTANNANYGYNLGYGTSAVSPQGRSYKYRGLQLRCVVRR